MKKAHIISHVHWDREWRYPLWQTRLMLVEYMDQLIDALEKGVYKNLVLDGQVIAIEDYLEVKPENETRLKKLIAQGRIDVGPWYTLPDEYPVDGECLIRNLQFGIQKSKELGKTLLIGYTSFGWGQISQLPQMYNGFGITAGVVCKGPSQRRTPDSEFIWESPDGSKILATRFGKMGRHNFFLDLYLSVLFGTDYITGKWEYKWGDEKTVFHRCEQGMKEQDYFWLDKPRKWHPEYITKNILDKTWDTIEESLLEDDHAMMNGCDYSAVQEFLPEIIKKINEIDKSNDRQWQQSTLSEFFSIMQQKLDMGKLKVIEGELRDGPASLITGNALATHMDIKILNKRAQNMLIKFAEPLSVIMDDKNETFLQKAWLYLLKSHPHDSINGVTQDKTANDVKWRLNQVIELSQAIGDKALKELIKNINFSHCRQDDIIIVAYNPLPYPRSEILEAFIDVPDTTEKYEFWPLQDKGLIVYDAEGNPLATQWHSASKEIHPVVSMHTRAFPFPCMQNHMYFETGMIPAAGYKVFVVRRLSDGINVPYKSFLTETNSIKTDDRTLENKFLKVTLNLDGTINIEAKELGKTFSNLNYYQDRGESGDYWISRSPDFDQAFSSLGCKAKIWTEFSGPLIATLVSEVELAIPLRLIRSEMRRSSDLKDIKIRTYVSLKANSRQVDVKVQFENVCHDHCLRVMFPTGISEATHVDSGGHFTVDRRPIKPQGPASDAYWPDMATLPTNNFIDVSDGRIGFAVIHNGFSEYEVAQNSQRTMAITLLKAVPTWICTESRIGSSYPSQNAGQCLVPFEYSYAIRPHSGLWYDSNIFNEADEFNVPINLIQTNKHNGFLPSSQHSFFSIINSLIRFSCLKYSYKEKSYILRLFNPTADLQESEISFDMNIESVWEVDFNENRSREIVLINSSTFQIRLKPYKICTYEIKRK
jgi:mannosylglycerate hydrolase